jgi:catechol 2,3-dioxygenase-like lactoylglutathione lyase family enzyme
MSSVDGLRGVEHIGFTVPDVDEAVRFFVDVLGCERIYDMGAGTDGEWLAANLGVHPESSIPTFALLRCANGANFEVFQYEAPDQKRVWPRLSDWGASHIAFYVDDMDAALATLERHGVEVLGEGKKDGFGPEAGDESTFAHFLTPWGQVLEFVSYPKGREYMRTAPRLLWRPE